MRTNDTLSPDKKTVICKKEVVNRLRRLREGENLSQKQLAIEFMINDSIISRIETETTSLSIDLLHKYHMHFDVPSDFILWGTGDLNLDSILAFFCGQKVTLLRKASNANENIDSSQIAARLYGLRNGKISQDKLANALNCSPQFISRLEKERDLPSLNMICKYSKYFQVTTDFILYGTEDSRGDLELDSLSEIAYEKVKNLLKELKNSNGSNAHIFCTVLGKI